MGRSSKWGLSYTHRLQCYRRRNPVLRAVCSRRCLLRRGMRLGRRRRPRIHTLRPMRSRSRRVPGCKHSPHMPQYHTRVCCVRCNIPYLLGMCHKRAAQSRQHSCCPSSLRNRTGRHRKRSSGCPGCYIPGWYEPHNSHPHIARSRSGTIRRFRRLHPRTIRFRTGHRHSRKRLGTDFGWHQCRSTKYRQCRF